MELSKRIDTYFRENKIKLLVSLMLSLYILLGAKTPDLVFNIIHFILIPLDWLLEQIGVSVEFIPKTYYILTTIYFFYFIKFMEKLIAPSPHNLAEPETALVGEYKDYYKNEIPVVVTSQIKTTYTFPTKSGTFVRSKGEQGIADFLHEHGIMFRYDTPLVIVRRAGERRQTFRPDFFLPDHNVIVEFWASYGEADYDKDMDRKKAFYVDAKMPFVSVEEFDLTNIDKILNEKLKRVIK